MGQLKNRMEQDLIFKNYSPATRCNYLLYCRKFAAHFGSSPEELGEEELREYLLHILQVEQVSYSTYRQVLAALKFLYCVTLGKPWEVERIPFPKRRERPFPDVVGHDDLLNSSAASRASSIVLFFWLVTQRDCGSAKPVRCELRTSIQAEW